MKFKIEVFDKDYTLNFFVYYWTGLLGKWKGYGINYRDISDLDILPERDIDKIKVRI